MIGEAAQRVVEQRGAADHAERLRLAGAQPGSGTGGNENGGNGHPTVTASLVLKFWSEG